MKNKINDLALFGGKTLFDKPIHVGRPNTGNHKKILNKIDVICEIISFVIKNSKSISDKIKQL